MKSRITVIIYFIFTLLLLILIPEAFLRIKLGSPALEPISEEFRYKYIDIYGKFFKNTVSEKGEIIYMPQAKNLGARGFTLQKDKNTKRIFILGGSIAQGFCSQENLHPLKEYLKVLLPHINFEIIACGMSAYDSYRVSLVQKEILNYKPDLIIIMSGNNEYYTPIKINLWMYRLNRVLRNLWGYRKFQDKYLEVFSEKYRSISKKERLKNYKRNLEIMVERAEFKKVPIILCALPANFKFPPNTKPYWEDRTFFSAWYMFENKGFKQAMKKFEFYLQDNIEDPYGYYLLGRCYEMLKDYAKAREYYLQALEFDANPGDRCPPSRNRVIHKLCRKEKGILVDLEKAFIDIAPHGLLGEEIFLDNCHWLEGFNSLVAKEIISSILNYNQVNSNYIFAPINVWDLQKWKGLEEKKIVISLAETARRRLYGALQYLLEALYRSETSFTNERSVYLIEQSYKLNSEILDHTPLIRDRLFAKYCNDSWIYISNTNFENTWPIFLWHAGETLRRLGLFSQTLEYFNESLSLNPNLGFAYLGRGLVYYALGNKEKGKDDFESAKILTNSYPLIDYYTEAIFTKDLK